MTISFRPISGQEELHRTHEPSSSQAMVPAVFERWALTDTGRFRAAATQGPHDR
jgi:hypothetical protein